MSNNQAQWSMAGKTVLFPLSALRFPLPASGFRDFLNSSTLHIAASGLTL
jgi:hypothetical protein